MPDYSNVDREISDGRLWRAKEILQGRLYGAGYEAELYERLGAVLLMMGDLPEAGKYLFLSGVRRAAYQDSIDLYLHRHAKSIQQLRGTFPIRVRTAELDSYPEQVVRDLVAAGFTLDQIRHGKKSQAIAGASRRESYIGYLIAAVVMVLFAGFLIQSARGIGWLLDRLSNS